jgi:hypothetical protein
VTEIYKALEEKNNWYRKYLACTEAYLVALKHAPEIALDELELFYGNRESLLKILDGLDVKIQGFVAAEERMGRELNTEQATKVQYLLREKDSIVERIVQLDKEMMADIEALKALSEQKLKNLAKGKKALSKYKSGNEKNDKLDTQV